MTATKDMQRKAQSIIDEKYDEFRKSVIEERNIRSFAILEDIKKKVDNYNELGIEISTKEVDELLSDKEKEKVYKELFLKSSKDPEWEPGYSRSKKDIFGLARNFANKLGCVITPDTAGEVLCQLIIKEDGYLQSKAYSKSVLSYVNYISITPDVAKQLIEWHGRNIFWNGDIVFEILKPYLVIEDKREGETRKGYHERKEREIHDIIDKADKIYLFGLNSYYGVVKLGDQIPK